MTTTFTESDHPRATTGEFATKAQSAPETTLTGSSTAPVLYTFRADTYTPQALVEHLVSIGELSPAARDMDVEEVLNQHAGANAIDRDDEESFDSDEFPKAVFEHQVTIDDHPALGREWWEVAQGEYGPQSAQDALDRWAEDLDLDAGTLDALWEGTDYDAGPEVVIKQVAENGRRLGVDFDALNSPVPVRHN